MIMLLDWGVVGIVSAAAFFFVLAAAAVIAFKLLKRSVKMALRVGIVAVILAIAVTGSVALWAFSSASSEKPRPARNR